MVAALGMSSCLDSDDPTFQVGGGGYIVQVNNGTTSTYFPMVSIQGNDYMTGGCNVSNGKVKVQLKDIGQTNRMYLVTDVNTQKLLADELSNVTGQYNIEAANGEGEVATSWFTLSASKGMGILKGGIVVNDQDITAYFNIIEGADVYTIFLQKDNYDIDRYGAKQWTETELKKAPLETEGEYEGCYKVTLKVQDLLGSSATLESGRYILVTTAISTNTSRGIVLLQEGPKQASYTKE